jgi:hypothetical protein
MRIKLFSGGTCSFWSPFWAESWAVTPFPSERAVELAWPWRFPSPSPESSRAPPAFWKWLGRSVAGISTRSQLDHPETLWDFMFSWQKLWRWQPSATLNHGLVEVDRRFNTHLWNVGHFHETTWCYVPDGCHHHPGTRLCSVGRGKELQMNPS